MIKINIKKKKIKIKNNDLLPIYLYIPKKIKFEKKIIIIIEEIFRINRKIKNICKKISKYRYICVIPKFLYKNEKINFNENINRLGEKIHFLSDKEIIYNIKNVIKWLKKKYKTDKIAITGFGWGGRITWLFSYFQEKYIKTSVIWCGNILNVRNYKHPIQPIEIIDKINIPVLGLYKKKNKDITFKIVKKIKKKINLNKNNKIKIIIYKKKQHNHLSPKKLYNKKITKKTWKKMINWFYINL